MAKLRLKIDVMEAGGPAIAPFVATWEIHRDDLHVLDISFGKTLDAALDRGVAQVKAALGSEEERVSPAQGEGTCRS